MSANQTWFIMQNACRALELAQEKFYLHLDFKANNLLLAKEPRAMNNYQPRLLVCDFGATLKFRMDQHLINDGYVGTLLLLLPEKYFIPSSDSWQLGMLLVTCRGGGMPAGNSLQALRDSGRYSHLREVEWQLLEECLKPDAGQRHPPKLVREHTKYFQDAPVCDGECIKFVLE